MGVFGFLKSKPIDPTPGARPPRLADLTAREKIMALSAIWNDDPETAMKIPLMAQQRARVAYSRAAENDLADFMTSKLIPQRPGAVASADDQDLPGLDPSLRIAAPKIDLPMRDPKADLMGGPVSMRAALPLLAEATRRGVDISPYAKMIEGVQPKWKYERGMRYDENDPTGPPKEIVDTDKGQTRLYDAEGRFAGIRNADGYVQSVAEMEGAKTRATEGAKADFDIGVYEDASGVPRRMTRGQAVAGLSGLPMVGDRQVGPGGAPAGSRATSSAVDISRGQSAAEKDAASSAAKAQVELDFTRPKAESALTAMDAKTKMVDDAINRVLGYRVDPKTQKPVRTGPSMISGWTAGAGSLLSALPGTPAKDLQASLETIKANLGFDELQTMRDNSPTGGALGQVAVQELEALRSTLSSLDQAQSPQQVEASLKRIQQIRAGAAERRRQAFARTYGAPIATSRLGAAGRTAESTASAPPPAQRQTGAIYQTPRGPMKWTGSGWLPQ